MSYKIKGVIEVISILGAGKLDGVRENSLELSGEVHHQVQNRGVCTIIRGA